MRTLMLSAVFTLMLSQMAVAAPPSLVLVQYHYITNSLTVTRGLGQTQTIELAPLDVKKKFQANAEGLYTLFAGLYGEGYTLQNSSEIGSSSSGTLTVNYVFVKP
ncbi:hypothetical protein [Hymenobacter negativus]|uniref:Uncharacterized protein n=1 Tax=Hymenobacter negativus TaxID=2795026 RepID=A0ABS0Q897_9BACT|nr:hypothetical protein [Hymenobacter negativus]MBH8558573.1 hypothetical protein [Hymenobacter negativus]